MGEFEADGASVGTIDVDGLLDGRIDGTILPVGESVGLREGRDDSDGCEVEGDELASTLGREDCDGLWLG